MLLHQIVLYSFIVVSGPMLKMEGACQNHGNLGLTNMQTNNQLCMSVIYY